MFLPLFRKIMGIFLLLLLLPLSYAGAGLQEEILEGALDEIKNGTKYNTEMLDHYVAPTFKNNSDTSRPVYPGGDVNPKEGVCTDLVVRALRNAGYDLQQEVHSDVTINKNRYGVKKPDKYIDHRRVWILNTFFKRKWQSLTTKLSNSDDWQPGDVVIWNTGSKTHLHIGIAGTKKRRDGFPHVIHNMRYLPLLYKGKTTEQDVLEGPKFLWFRVHKWQIIGHYRIRK